MLTLSTTTATPSTSKTLSSSFALSKARAYWKPEQPPPRTATRSACSPPSGWEPSSSPIFSAAKSDSASRIADVSSPAETAVVCDTTGYLPTELVAEREIKTISLYVSVDGHQERESEIVDFDAFYERLRASESG